MGPVLWKGCHMSTANDTHSHVSRLVAANNDLGFRLLSQLAKQDPDKNLFLSSFSVAIALAMAYNGAEGETKRAMAQVLGLTGLDLQEVNAANAAFLSMQGTLDPKVHLAVANSIWAANDIELAPDFVQRIRDHYAGEVTNVDFYQPGAADIINKWVAGKTHDKIRGVVTPEVVRSAILILINAIYFKGIWTRQFDEEKTEERAFTLLDGSRKQHPMMSQSGYYDYYENESFQAISLPYGEGRISMYVFLPRPTVSMGEFQQALTADNWQQWMSRFYWMEGDLVLPRFKVEYGVDLLPNRMALGGGDLVGMGAGPLAISNVIHRAFVEVNEEGTEAAAVTAVVVVFSPEPRFRMIVDRPFFCAIRDNETGALLFMGFVVNPMQS